MKIKRTRNIVKTLLTKYKSARDNDTLLILIYLNSSGLLAKKYSVNELKEITKKIPSLMSLGRMRAYIQNVEKDLLPSEKIQKKRKILNNEVREELRQ